MVPKEEEGKHSEVRPGVGPRSCSGKALESQEQMPSCHKYCKS